MKQNQEEVKEFMVAADQDVPDSPSVPSFEMRRVRVMLLLEEVLEFAEAAGVSVMIDENERDSVGVVNVRHSKDFFYVDDGEDAVDLTEVADGLCDIEYVNQGAGVAFGIDLEPCWDEVHDSNMSKFIDGHKDPETGKWIKGPSYRPANLEPIIDAQIERVNWGTS